MTSQPRTLSDANLFDFAGPMQINYSSSSIKGVPLLSYQDAQLNLNFENEDITRVALAGGEELVTVTLEQAVDAFVRTLTLVIPGVRVAMGDVVEFETIAVETVDRSQAFVAPPGPAGALQTYLVHQIRGSAQAVNF
ncbi:hypothetical protein [Symbioplanes lichenis]|uniref:hypothetical protein n=1 Tax=Symbioplanes lichenis TaxID=1629072 RepID=UPI00273844CD|nr:hypothetical protein [Actinoplanes lichenis]